MSNLAATSTLRLAARAASRSKWCPLAAAPAPAAGGGNIRKFGMKRVYVDEHEVPASSVDTVKPPEYWSEPPALEPDPAVYVRKPISSAQMIDVTSDPPCLSEKDKATLKASGSIVHGTFGELDSSLVEGIPLEYLALLGPSAEGAAAVRALSEKASGAKGTLLVFGASQPAGLSAAQLGAAAGHSVVAVVGGEHSGNEEMCDIVKGLTKEPGFMVPEEIAMIKQTFKELVMDSATANTKSSTHDPDQFLTDFKQNLLDYIATYPETLPAAVDKSELVFDGKDKDRTYFRENMEAYLEQFPKGAPTIPEQDLNEKFPKEQYAVWKAKFGKQTTSVISGAATSEDFLPADIVKQMIAQPEPVGADLTTQASGDFISYDFSVLNESKTDLAPGGSIIGAIVVDC